MQVLKIEPDESHIRYMGRIDFSDPKNPQFDWPGVEIGLSFTGKKITVVLYDGGNDYNVILDGKLHKVIETEKGKEMYLLADNLDEGKHEVIIAKRTESYDGICVFRGFVLDKDAKIFENIEKKKLKIEFIGDSITAGFGVEGPGVECDSERKYKNNYLAFGPVLSRKVGAEYNIAAISGRGVVKNYGEKGNVSKEPMPYYYERALMNCEKKWDFSSFVPDMVFINLGTNDFSAKPVPDEKTFIKGYLDLIKKVRGYYENAFIFCVSGPAQEEPFGSYIKKIVTDAGDNKVILIKTGRMSSDELGCQWHPNAAAQERMAGEIYGQIKKYIP